MNRVKIGAKDDEFILRFQEGDTKRIPEYGLHAKKLLKTLTDSNIVKILELTIQSIVRM